MTTTLLAAAVSLLMAAPAMADTGNIWAWGFGGDGALGTGGTSTELMPVEPQMPEEAGEIVAVSAGLSFSLALAADGSVWAWGRGDNGQLGTGSTDDELIPVETQIPDEAGEIVAISAEGNSSLALGADGRVWAWGNNFFGQLGDGTTEDRLTPVETQMPDEAGQIVAVSTGSSHSLAVDDDGRVWAWGLGGNGRLGTGSTASALTPVETLIPNEAGEIIAVSAGSLHSVALSADGSVWAWGRGAEGRLGTASTDDELTPVETLMPEEAGEIVAVSATHHSVALGADGRVWAWGRGEDGQLGIGSTDDELTPVETLIPDEAGEIIAISTGTRHSLAVGADGRVWGWGSGSSGRLGTGDTFPQLTPIEPLIPDEAGEIVAVSAGHNHSLALGSPSDPPVAVCEAYPTNDLDGFESTNGGILVECDGPDGREVTLDATGSFQPDDPDAELDYQWDVSEHHVTLDDPQSAVTTGVFPIGVTTVTLTVENEFGLFDTCDITVHVQDTEPPEVMITTDKAALWPPNHTMREVEVIITASDVCEDPDFIFPLGVWVSSNEPDNAPGSGDGDTTGDVHGEDGYTAPVELTDPENFDDGIFEWDADYGENGAWIGTIELRAERAGSGSGRAYTIFVQALDSNLNIGESSIVVVVPKSQGHGGGNN